jgi:hypothetical protein
VTTEKDKDHARGWLFVQKLMDEAEDERFDKLSEEEQLAELEKAGAKPSAEWDPDELLAMAAAHAAKTQGAAGKASVSTGEGVKDTGVGVKAPTAEPPKVPAAGGPITRIVPVRRRWLPALLAAAALGCAYIVFLIVRPPPPVMLPPPHLDPPERAAALRDDAKRDCAAHHWKDCLDELDEARALDPKGDESTEVKAMRASAKEWKP